MLVSVPGAQFTCFTRFTRTNVGAQFTCFTRFTRTNGGAQFTCFTRFTSTNVGAQFTCFTSTKVEDAQVLRRMLTYADV
jgi:hypothetical protein